MLVLSRKVDEVIYIGDDIKVIVTEIRGNKCRIGIEAPSHLIIDRGEVRLRKQQTTDDMLKIKGVDEVFRTTSSG